jgi:cell pole-organizing protein PopZ
MTQPAKVQEPSMEEILASIRRIIADDEAKPATAELPAAAEKPAAPEPPPKKPEPPKPAAVAPAAKPAMAPPAAQAAAPKPAPAPAPKPAPPPPAPVSNSQDDIDAMLAGLDAEIAPPAPPPPEPEDEVFELTDDMAVATPPPPQPSFRRVEPDQDVEFAEAVAASDRRLPAFDQPSWDAPAAPPGQPILSRTTVSAVESAFNSLANTVLSNNARTLEDLVKEMLRPMLKSWLDDNLPGLVERIVKAEIERVSRGGRS